MELRDLGRCAEPAVRPDASPTDAREEAGQEVDPAAVPRSSAPGFAPPDHLHLRPQLVADRRVGAPGAGLPDLGRSAMPADPAVELLLPSEVARCRSFTQVAYPGAGTIDLVLQVEVDDDVFELWIEVKVDAPESGDQLRSYARYIEAHERQVRRHLAVLSKDGLETNLPLAQLRWRDVGRSIARLAPNDTVWADLGSYLEEIRMTDGTAFPITVREAAALDDAVSLVRKANAVLTVVNDELLRRGFPEYLHWKTHGWVTTKLYDQFTKHGRLMLFGASGYPTPVFYGFVPVDGEVRAIVWIEANPRRTEERQRVRDFAAAHLDGSWVRPADLWQLVWKSERGVSLASEAEAASWFLDRLEELRRAGFFEFLETLRPTTVEPEEQETPDEAARAQALDVEAGRQ